jgi:UDP-glucose 4-epimerase
MNHSSVLVLGGAGYIGSHVVRQLGEAGYQVIVYDNCSTGHADAVLAGQFILGDLSDLDRLYQVFAKHQFEAVLHFAASLVVPESVAQPLDYYSNNTRNTLNVLRCCQAFGVTQMVFSSTAAVYGEPKINPVHEATPPFPINPYGRSKLMSEWMIQDFSASSDFRYVILRYFNVVGADPTEQLGQRTPMASHLVRAACDAALQRHPHVAIFGTDFPTFDGTAIRDFIHVEDLASAHVDALRYLMAGRNSQVLNCGYGNGYSVRQVLDCLKNLTEIDFPILESGRRTGDPGCVVANASKIEETLGWLPQYNDLELMVGTAFLWEIQRELTHQPTSPMSADCLVVLADRVRHKLRDKLPIQPNNGVLHLNLNEQESSPTKTLTAQNQFAQYLFSGSRRLP